MSTINAVGVALKTASGTGDFAGTASPSFSTDITVNGIPVGIGYANNTTNVAIGLNGPTGTFESSVAIGYSAMQYASADTSDTVSIGYMSMSTSGGPSGTSNTAVGSYSLGNISSGSENTALGYNAGGGGTPITSGSYNTLLGWSTFANSETAQGCLAIGADATAIKATGSTSGTNGPGISIGSSTYPVGFRGDGKTFAGGTTAGYWQPVINGTAFLIPLFVSGTLTTSAILATDTNGIPIVTTAIPSGTTQTTVITAPANSASSSLAIGTAYHNTAGYDVMITVYLAVSAATSASILLGVGSTSTPTQQTIISGLTLGALNIIPINIYIPSNYYALLSTSGTITQTISGQLTMAI